eukprot:1347328-Amorphochlora_amoeboformis.AAC.1
MPISDQNLPIRTKGRKDYYVSTPQLFSVQIRQEQAVREREAEIDIDAACRWTALFCIDALFSSPGGSFALQLPRVRIFQVCKQWNQKIKGSSELWKLMAHVRFLGSLDDSNLGTSKSREALDQAFENFSASQQKLKVGRDYSKIHYV